MADDLVNTLRADAGSRPDHDQGNQKNKGHNHLAGKHNKGVNRAEAHHRALHVHAVEDVSADPEDGQRKPHHDQHDKWCEEGDDTAGEELYFREVRIDLVKFSFLVGLGVERTDDTDTRKVFSGSDVQSVRQLLDDPELRRHHHEQENNGDHKDNEPDCRNDGQGIGSGLHEENQGPYHRNRSDKGRFQKGEPRKMDILHIVGRSRDQRFCREGGKVRNGKFIDALIHLLSELCDRFGGRRAGDKTDDDLDRGHQDRADDHVKTIPPDLGDTIFPAGLHGPGKLTDVAYNLHHEKNLKQSQQEYRENR